MYINFVNNIIIIRSILNKRLNYSEMSNFNELFTLNSLNYNTTIANSMYKFLESLCLLRLKQDLFDDNRGSPRHCCALFIEGNKQCLLPDFDWLQQT